MTTLSDIQRLRSELGWSWTRIGAHYKVSERMVRNWADGNYPAPDNLPPPVQLNYGTALIVNDIQYPYYDPALWEVVCQIARDAEVETVMWAGDLLDFPQLGRFAHDRYRLSSADADVTGFHRDVREPLLKQAPTIGREFWENGNHEHRYEDYRDKNDQAAGTAFFPSMRDFLRLPANVEFAPYGKASGHYLTPKLLVCHGWYARKHSAYTAKAHAEEIGGVSLITGHTHRLGAYFHTTVGGVQVSYEVGHMCDEKTVPKATTGKQNWQQSAGALVFYERDGDAFRVDLNPVFGRRQDRVVAAGREYHIER